MSGSGPVAEDASEPGDRCGVLFVGVKGAVATTTMAGVFSVRRGLAPPTGLLTESPACAGVPVTPLTGFRFGGWDIAPGSVVDATHRNAVVPDRFVDAVEPDLRQVDAYPGILHNVTRVVRETAGSGDAIPTGGLRDAVNAVRAHVNAFRETNGVDRVVVVNLASAEPAPGNAGVVASLDALEAAVDANDPALTSGVLYAYAAMREGCPVVDFTPNVTVETPAIRELAAREGVPFAGKDGKTGQTAYKTTLATLFKARELRVKGWYSANVLGNRDGAVLRDEAHAAGKLAGKRGSLERILGYGDFDHQVRIDYYAPRGDWKEAWDVIDFEGWLGTRMTMRVNWQGEDSALAAPLVMDLARFTDLAHRRGETGALRHLAQYFKNPLDATVHALPDQHRELLAYLDRVRGGTDPGDGSRRLPVGVPQS